MKNILLRLEQRALKFASDKAYNLWIEIERRSQALRLRLIEESMPPARKRALRDELERMSN